MTAIRTMITNPDTPRAWISADGQLYSRHFYSFMTAEEKKKCEPLYPPPRGAPIAWIISKGEHLTCRFEAIDGWNVRTVLEQPSEGDSRLPTNKDQRPEVLYGETRYHIDGTAYRMGASTSTTLESQPRAAGIEAARQFIAGKISTGKLGELLGLSPGEIHDFKNACARTFEDIPPVQSAGELTREQIEDWRKVFAIKYAELAAITQNDKKIVTAAKDLENLCDMALRSIAPALSVSYGETRHHADGTPYGFEPGVASGMLANLLQDASAEEFMTYRRERKGRMSAVKHYTHWCSVSHGHHLLEEEYGSLVAATDYEALLAEKQSLWEQLAKCRSKNVQNCLQITTLQSALMESNLRADDAHLSCAAAEEERELLQVRANTAEAALRAKGRTE